MRSSELIELLGGRDNIADACRTPAGILFTLKNTDAYRAEDNPEIRAVQKGNQAEVLLEDSEAEAVMKLTKQKGPLSVKRILARIMDVLSGSLVPLLPMLMGAAMIKTVVSVLGPDMLNLIPAGSDLHTLLTFTGDAGFYFFPVAVGYTSAKMFHTEPMLGLFLGAILIHPTFVGLAEQGAKFSVYGLPVTPLNYSSTILPVLLSVWFLSAVEKGMKRVIPSALKDVFVPFCSVAIVLPVMLGILAPAGSRIGSLLCESLIYLGNRGGIVTILTIAVLGALWEFIIMGGLHWLFISTVFVILAQNGQETIITPMCAAAAFATGGMAIGAALRQRDKAARSSCISCAAAQIVGGVTEPALYGVGFRYRKPFLGLIAGAFAGSLYAGLVHLTAYNFIPSASFLCFLNYAGGSTMNFINGIISGVIGFAVSAVCTWLIGNDSGKQNSAD